MREMDKETIDLTYKVLKGKMKEHHRAAGLAILTRAMLEKAKLARLADGTIAGKNEQLREASARELLPHLHRDYEDAEDGEREAKLQLDLARIEVERVRALLRLAEIESRAKWFDDEIEEADPSIFA